MRMNNFPSEKQYWCLQSQDTNTKNKESNVVDGKVTKITISLLDALPEDKMN